MNHPDYDYMLVMERRRDELAAAEHSRLVKEARLTARQAGRGLILEGAVPARLRLLGETLALSLAQFLSSAGAWLLSLSCRLKTRAERSAELFSESAVEQPSPCA